VVLIIGLTYMLLQRPYGKSNAPENDAIEHAEALRSLRK